MPKALPAEDARTQSLQFIATVWYNASETQYTFGPFTANGCKWFLDRLRKLDPGETKFGDVNFEVLNGAKLCGTGLEMS